jgi:hypothetical protein
MGATTELEAARYGMQVGLDKGDRDTRAVVAGEVAEYLLDAGHPIGFIAPIVRLIRLGRSHD